MADSREKSKQKAALLSSVDELEAAFYEAMQMASIERMMALWADDEDIACVPPGGLRLVGGVAIRAGFEAVFSNGPIQIELVNVRRLTAPGFAVHHVLEKISLQTSDAIQTAYVLATNVYVQGADGWRMVLHHASPGRSDDRQEMIEVAPVLH
jgi:uncharacterized protein (TIGR02246 family)